MKPAQPRHTPNWVSTIMKFLRKEVGEMDILPKKPLFEQDLEFIIDCTGIVTPAALQLSFLHCLSASCAARPTSLSETYVREEIEQLRQELGLGSYPAGAGLTIKDVEFRSNPTVEVTMCITFSHEKPQAANKSHKRVFVVTPKKPGSPYCPITLGFLHIA